ncbi:MAG: hypothetical protein ACN2B6_10010 [Rickettsiales bacterium]
MTNNHPYARIIFAESLSHWGKALFVEEWHTPVILREIDGGGIDAAGVYPFCVLPKDADIAGGLERLKQHGAVSVVMVLDDFHRPELDVLKPHFPMLRDFKTHYVHDYAKGEPQYDSHHRRGLRKAQQQVRVDVVDLKTHWRDWQKLYDYIIRDMKLSGLHAFPAAHHEALAPLEGIAAIGAWMDDELVSAHIWAGDGEMMHSHLVASNAKGYETRAAYAVNDFSIKHFAGAKLLNFGGGAGVADAEEGGLARFKRGFSNATAKSYIAGAILDEERYAALSGDPTTSFFPAYRDPAR